jgi:hypothetical protein
MRLHGLSFAVFAAVLWWASAGAEAGTLRRGPQRVTARRPGEIHLSASTVGRYERLEMTVPVREHYANPYDPDQVDLRASITTPSRQRLSVPGFYYQGYTRSQDADGREVLAPEGPGLFKIRFAWGETGRYRFAVTVHDSHGTRTVGRGMFVVTGGTDQGYVRRSAAAPHYFQLDSGAPYFAIGENVGWPIHGITYDYDLWFNKLADNGGNYARLWLVNNWNALGLEKSSAASPEDGLGRYDQQSAWRIDYISNLARRRGMRLMFCIDSFNSLATGLYGEWGNFAYSAANGGPCAAPADFFTNAEAKAYFKKRLRYLVARWGYATEVMSWEFWNEVDIVDDYDSASVAAWHQEMGDYLRSIDPWQHLITTSFANSPGDAAIDVLPEMDYVQTHSYGTHDAAGTVAAFTQMKLDGYGKPTYLGEFGIDWQPDSYPMDTDGLHLHNGLWASAHAGAAGTPMTWWWDSYVEPNDLYYHFAGLAAYVADIDWVQESYGPAQVSSVAYAPGSPPVYAALAIDPPGESWADSVFNEPHTFTVGNDGSVSNLEVMSRVVHSINGHPEWLNPPTFVVNYPIAGRFEVNIHAVSGWGGAALKVTLDDAVVLTADFPDTQPDDHDTLYQYNGAYGIDVAAGPHTILVENTGSDWFYASYRLTNYVTAPNLRMLALANGTSAIVWAQNRDSTWWQRANGLTPAALPVCLITLGGLSPGTYRVERWDTWVGAVAQTSQMTSTDGTLVLSTPEGLTSDVAWKVRKNG